MNWLKLAVSAALYFVVIGAILAFFKGAGKRTPHEQLRDDIDQIEAVSRPGELS